MRISDWSSDVCSSDLGNVEAYSHFTNSASEATTLYNSAGEATENSASYATTLAGGDANVAVGTKSEIGGSVYADGDKTATVSNAGMIEVSVIADTLHSVVSSTSKRTNLNNVGLRKDETINAHTGICGTPPVHNAAGSIHGGAISVAGGSRVHSTIASIAGQWG